MRYGNTQRIGLVGTGTSGRAFAIGALCRNIGGELLLCDAEGYPDEELARALGGDLSQSRGRMTVRGGSPEDFAEVGLAVITPESEKREGETDTARLRRLALVLDEVTDRICAGGFDGIFLVATESAELACERIRRSSGFPSARVIGVGTISETAGLQRELGSLFEIDSREVRAFALGARDGRGLVPWSQTYVADQAVATFFREKGEGLRGTLKELEAGLWKNEARDGIGAKIGSGLALLRLAAAVLEDERCVLTVSCRLTGEYGEEDLYVAVPAVIGSEGVARIQELRLTGEEQEIFSAACDHLRSLRREILRSDRYGLD